MDASISIDESDLDAYLLREVTNFLQAVRNTTEPVSDHSSKMANSSLRPSTRQPVRLSWRGHTPPCCTCHRRSKRMLNVAPLRPWHERQRSIQPVRHS